MKVFVYFALLLTGTALWTCSCENKKKELPVKFNQIKLKKDSTSVEVPYQELGGVKTIPVKLNGVSMDMIFDTGCSGVSISLNELLTMQKNGKFSEADVVGVTEATIADGSVVNTGLINISEIEISGAGGSIKQYNVQASVSLNQIAPVLLGNTVLDGVKSIEVDNSKKVIRFRKY